MTPGDTLDGRLHPRVNVRRFKVVWRTGGGIAAFLSPRPGREAVMNDCSEKGVRFMAVEPLEEGTRVRLRLALSFMRDFSVSAVVVRCRQRSSPEKRYKVWEVGAVLNEPPPVWLEMVRQLRRDPLLRQKRL